MNTTSIVHTKKYKSELGKLYQSKRDEAPLQKIVFEIYSLFKFWIESGEMLPISISAKDYRPFTSTEIMRILDELEQRGCVVEFKFDSRTDKQFVLVDLT